MARIYITKSTNADYRVYLTDNAADERDAETIKGCRLTQSAGKADVRLEKVGGGQAQYSCPRRSFGRQTGRFLTCGTLCALFLAMLLAFPAITEAGWTWKREINITYSGTALTNYQVMVELTSGNFNYGNLASTDGDDIRFSTDGSGTQTPDCDYWIESWSYGGTSRIWVEVPSISGDMTIYMYYGNASASATSDGDATFSFFDDFNDGNYNGWTVQQDEWRASNYYLEGRAYGDNSVITLDSPAAQVGRAIRSKVMTTADWKYPILLLGWQNIDNFYRTTMSTGKNTITLHKKVGGALTPLAEISTSADLEVSTWYWLELRWVSSTQLKGEIWDINGNSLATIEGTIAEGWTSGNYGAWAYGGVYTNRFDDVIIRKYVSSEPSASVTSTETQNDYSLPVELSTFTATSSGGKVILYWRTESEVENLGFNIYRALEEEGQYNKINPELIQGAGSSASAHDYSFTDTRLTNGVTYWYKLEDVDLDGTKTMHGPIFATPQFVREEFVALPGEYGLSQSYPNPFNPGTVVEYRLPEDGYVTLRVYDALGHLVKTLVDRNEQAGYKSVWWDGRDDVGGVLGSGVYFCRMEVGGRFVDVRKMVILR